MALKFHGHILQLSQLVQAHIILDEPHIFKPWVKHGNRHILNDMKLKW
jgi:CRISPR/Cas system-associated endonuclease/helicase Cas3